MSIQEKEQEIIDEFAIYEDWMDKYEYIIELGKDLPLIEEKYKTEDRLIKGCQSQVWLHAETKDGKMKFTADRSEEHTSELQSRPHLVCRLLLEKKKKKKKKTK